MYFIAAFEKDTDKFCEFVSCVTDNPFMWDSVGEPLSWEKFGTAKKWAGKINQAAPRLNCKVVEIKESEGN